MVIGSVLTIVAFAAFAPGGETATAFEAALLQFFISATLVACSAVGYGLAVTLVARRHTTLRLPALFGVVAGAITFAIAAVGGVNYLARLTNLSAFIAVAILGFIVGLVTSSIVVVLTERQRNERV